MFSYYTTKEVDDLLAGKSPLIHYHDEFQDMLEITAGIEARIQALHDLIGPSSLAQGGTCFSILGWRTFYSRWEVDDLLAMKSDIGHTHDFSAIVNFDPNVAMGVLHGLLFEIADNSDLGVRDVNNGAGVEFYLGALHNGVRAERIVLPGGRLNTNGFLATNGGFAVTGYSGTLLQTMLSATPSGASTPVIDATTLTAELLLTISGDHIIIDGRKSASKSGNNLVLNLDAAYPNGINIEGPGITAPSFSVSSSSAVKQNILPIADSRRALLSSPVYNYRYKGQTAMKIGLMFEEADPRITHNEQVDVTCMVAMALDALKEVAHRAGGVECR